MAVKRKSKTLGNLLAEVERYSQLEDYEISLQIWGKNNNNGYIRKRDVEIYGRGGFSTAEDLLTDMLKYLYRIRIDTPRIKGL